MSSLVSIPKLSLNEPLIRQVKPDDKSHKRILTPTGEIRKFEEIGISTKTIIAVTNIRVNMDLFYKYIPITDYTPIEKKRGRKKRIIVEQIVPTLPFGSVVTVQRRRDIRGTVFKSKSKKNNTYFLHSITIVMSLHHNKFVNIKVSTNGKFQITGCKTNEHYELSMIGLVQNLERIKEYTGEESYSLTDVSPSEPSSSRRDIKVIFNTVMQNMDFNIGFPICRNKLDTFINQHTEFCSIFEGSINTEVNIKVPIIPVKEIDLHHITFNTQDGCRDKEGVELYTLYRDTVPYQLYCDLLNEKERKKEVTKERYHTFLVFASGSVIMSSRGPDMKRVFYEFIHILLQHRRHFEETGLQASCSTPRPK
jgi:hypothetical protein